jgi:hypothetical protein
MGAAMWSTLIAMFFTVYGCCALSTNQSIVEATHWVYIDVHHKVIELVAEVLPHCSSFYVCSSGLRLCLRGVAWAEKFSVLSRTVRPHQVPNEELSLQR